MYGALAALGGGMAASALGNYQGSKSALGAVKRQIAEQAGYNRQMEKAEAESAGRTLGSLSQMQAQPVSTGLLTYMPSAAGMGVDSSQLAMVQNAAATDRSGDAAIGNARNAALASGIKGQQMATEGALRSLGDQSAERASHYGDETADAARKGQWLRLAGGLTTSAGKMALAHAPLSSTAPAPEPTPTGVGEYGTPLSNWQKRTTAPAYSPLTLR